MPGDGCEPFGVLRLAAQAKEAAGLTISGRGPSGEREVLLSSSAIRDAADLARSEVERYLDGPLQSASFDERRESEGNQPKAVCAAND